MIPGAVPSAARKLPVGEGDDAVWAAPDDDPGNPGGYKAIVAIAA